MEKKKTAEQDNLSWKEDYERDYGGVIRPEPESWKEFYKMRQSCNLRISIMMTKVGPNLISAGFDKIISYSTSSGNDNHYAFINRRGKCYVAFIRSDKAIDFAEMTYFSIKDIPLSQVAFGTNFLLVLSKDGHVYLVNDFNNRDTSVTHLSQHRSVKNVFAKDRMALLFDDGEVYITGANIIDRQGVSFPPDPAPFNRVIFEEKVIYLFNQLGAVWQYNLINGDLRTLPTDLTEYETGYGMSFFFRKELLQIPSENRTTAMKRLYSTIFDPVDGVRNEQVYLPEVPEEAQFLSVGQNHVAFMVEGSIKVYPFQSAGFLTAMQEYTPISPKDTTMEFLDIASGKNYLLVYTKYSFRTKYLEGIKYIRPILENDDNMSQVPVGSNHKVYYEDDLVDHYVEILRDEQDNILPPIEDVSFQEMQDEKSDNNIAHEVWYPGHQRKLYAPNRRLVYYLKDGSTFTAILIPSGGGVDKADSMFR